MNANGLVLKRDPSGADFFQFEHFAAFPEVVHGIFLRRGGWSRPPFHELNTSLAVGDDPESVRRNRARVGQSLAVGELVFARQEHGAEVLVIEDMPLDPAAAWATAARPGDAMTTARPGAALVVQVADCQAVLLYDPTHRVVANVHAGWRGSVAGILGVTVATMQARFGTRAGDLVAGIGPSLGPCCAEFIHYRREIPAALWGYRGPGDRFDFWSISRDQLQAAGVPAENIRTGGLCTRCHPELFFSYRGEKRTGRFAAAIGVR